MWPVQDNRKTGTESSPPNNFNIAFDVAGHIRSEEDLAYGWIYVHSQMRPHYWIQLQVARLSTRTKMSNTMSSTVLKPVPHHLLWAETRHLVLFCAWPCWHAGKHRLYSHPLRLVRRNLNLYKFVTAYFSYPPGMSFRFTQCACSPGSSFPPQCERYITASVPLTHQIGVNIYQYSAYSEKGNLQSFYLSLPKSGIAQSLHSIGLDPKLDTTNKQLPKLT